MESSMKRIFLLFAIVLFLGACSEDPITGEFAWSTTDDRGVLEPERGLLVETEFRFGRKNLIFNDFETIWWIYQINSGKYNDDEFLAVLYENNGSPDPAEVDLRQVRIFKQSGKGIIRQKYEELEPGSYILKIAYKSLPVDEVEFEVLPMSDPTRIQDEPPEGADEIIYYSRSRSDTSF